MVKDPDISLPPFRGGETRTAAVYKSKWFTDQQH